jgi:hypothetical protein
MKTGGGRRLNLTMCSDMVRGVFLVETNLLCASVV